MTVTPISPEAELLSAVAPSTCRLVLLEAGRKARSLAEPAVSCVLWGPPSVRWTEATWHTLRAAWQKFLESKP